MSSQNKPFAFLIFFAALFFSQPLLEAQVLLKGKVHRLAPGALQVALAEYWSVDHWQQLGVLQMEDGAFSLNITPPPVTAQARIRLAGQKRSWSEFLVEPAGKGPSELVFDLNADEMNGGPAQLPGSEENERYFQLMSAFHRLQQLRDSSSQASPEQIRQEEEQLNEICRRISTQNRGTFCGDIVANLFYTPAVEPKAPPSLEKIIFQYEGNLYHNAFVKALNRYYQFFDHQNAEASKRCIDGVMARRNGNQAVDLFLFKYLLDKALDQKDEAGVQHLLTWYPPDCSDESPLPNGTKFLIETLKQCEPGKQVAELELIGQQGERLSLDEVCKKQKLTLLFFWKSNCSHCQEFKPVLKNIYKEYHAKGMEVLAMSLDKTEEGWKSTLQADPTEWVNAYIPQALRGQVNRQFPIPSTPTLIALDRNRKVVSRLILRDHLEAYLNETLPQLSDK